jgi:prevent-host-death family protein
MLNTHVRPARDLRNHYADIKKTLEQNDHVIITNNGVGESVLIGIELYAKFEEFLHHQFIYQELQKSKDKAGDPNVMRHDAEDVFTEFDQILKARGL